MAFSTMLLHGVKEEKRHFLMPWLIWSLLYIATAVGVAVLHIVLGDFESIAAQVVVPIIYCITFVVWGYFYLCVLSYFRQMTTGETELCS